MKTTKLLTLALLVGAAIMTVSCKKDKDSKLVSVQDLEFYDAFFTVQVGDSYVPDVLVKPAEAYSKLKWKSSDTDVLTVENGVIKAKAAGSATVTAISSQINAEVDVEVVPKRYELCQMKLNSSDQAVKNVLEDNIVWDVDNENHYLIFWDNETGTYIKNAKTDTFEGKLRDKAAESKFGPIKNDWGIYQYYGILVVPKKPCEKTQLNLAYDESSAVSIRKTINIETYYRRKYYLVNNTSHQILPSLLNIGSGSIPVICYRCWGKDSEPEAIVDSYGSHYVHSGTDENLTVTYSPDNLFFYTVARKGTNVIDKSNDIWFGYNNDDQNEHYLQPLWFTTKAVNYYDLPEVTYDR